MNVLLISQYFPPDIGGVATRTNNLVKSLAENNCRVTVIAAFPHYPNGHIPDQYRRLPIKVEQIGKVKIIRTFILPIKSQGFLKRLLLIGSFAVSALFALPWVGKIDVVWGTSWIPGIVYSRVKKTILFLARGFCCRDVWKALVRPDLRMRVRAGGAHDLPAVFEDEDVAYVLAGADLHVLAYPCVNDRENFLPRKKRQ
jgi:hypothetical protein